MEQHRCDEVAPEQSDGRDGDAPGQLVHQPERPKESEAQYDAYGGLNAVGGPEPANRTPVTACRVGRDRGDMTAA